jgi:HAD superfamily hydrolase (TIGR01544 family)
MVSILRSENHLTEKYTKEAYALESIYRPIENDEKLDYDIQFEEMVTWWEKHARLIIDQGLNISHIREASLSPKMRLREGVRGLFVFAKTNKIPVVIFSASVIGFESIEFFLERENLLSDNIHIVSNHFLWDKNGVAVDIKEPLIHSMSKNGLGLKEFNVFSFIKNKSEAIVIGDNIHDRSMADGLVLKKLKTYGVVNDLSLENINHYKNIFDEIILDGESLEKVLEVFK